ncbi:MAG TPA: DUF1829 domain-containing protein [Pantanalinema sp.]
MLSEARRLIVSYTDWLKDRTALRDVNGWVEIQTPFLDRHNDRLVIYLKEENGTFWLTDDGYTLDDLRMSGCELKTPKRLALLQTILNGHGVQLLDDALCVQATREDFPHRKHSLVQAMVTVNDLFVLAAGQVQSLFLEDVQAWLEDNDIRYAPSVNFTGKSGFSHHFDFVIPHSKKKPERIVKAINRPARDSAQNLAFAWVDSREVRPPNAELIAFLNDDEHKIPSGVTEALGQYGIRPVPWSKRHSIRDNLVA